MIFQSSPWALCTSLYRHEFQKGNTSQCCKQSQASQQIRLAAKFNTMYLVFVTILSKTVLDSSFTTCNTRSSPQACTGGFGMALLIIWRGAIVEVIIRSFWKAEVVLAMYSTPEVTPVGEDNLCIISLYNFFFSSHSFFFSSFLFRITQYTFWTACGMMF